MHFCAFSCLTLVWTRGNCADHLGNARDAHITAAAQARVHDLPMAAQPLRYTNRLPMGSAVTPPPVPRPTVMAHS